MIRRAPPVPTAILLAGGFVLQGLLVARSDRGGAAVVLPLFGALAVAVATGLPGFRGSFAGSAALGGLGMAAGAALDSMGHAAMHHAGVSAPAALVSWSGLLMLVGCTAACFLPSGSSAARSLLHHGSSLAGMLIGMHLVHPAAALGDVELSASVLHLAMVAMMLAGGWVVLTLVNGVVRRPRRASGPSGGELGFDGPSPEGGRTVVTASREADPQAAPLSDPARGGQRRGRRD